MAKMKILLTKGQGEGITEESAYCRALDKAGLMNLNLIYLSSVLPHNCEIVKQRPVFSCKDYGKKLYAIVSQARTSRINESVCAGLGWMIEEEGDGNGLVIQAEGKDETEVVRKIENSLDEVAKNASEKYKRVKVVTEKATCIRRPVCVLVALVFKLEDWL